MSFTCHKIKAENLYCSFMFNVEYFKHVWVQKLFKVSITLLKLNYDFGPRGYAGSFDFIQRSRLIRNLKRLYRLISKLI